MLTDLLEQSRDVAIGSCVNNSDLKDLAGDVRSKSLHDLLALVARSNAEKSIKTLALRLMLRIGLIFGAADDCLLAARL